MNDTGGTVWGLLNRTISDIGIFLQLGNFRPLGRLLVDLEHMLTFETALATGIPPDVLHGGVRLLALFLMAFVASQFTRALTFSHIKDLSPIRDDRYRPHISLITTTIFPLTLATVLVVYGVHPIIVFPFWSMISVALILGIPLLIVSDTSIREQWTWFGQKNAKRSPKYRIQLAGIVLLGAAVPLIYDLLYLVPVLCIITLIIRGRILARMDWPTLYSSGAFARLLSFLGGFIPVFIAARILIATACSAGACSSEATNVNIQGLAPTIVFNRILAGFPSIGWRGSQDTLSPQSLLFDDLSQFLSNGFVFIAVVTIVALTIYSCWKMIPFRSFDWRCRARS